MLISVHFPFISCWQCSDLSYKVIWLLVKLIAHTIYKLLRNADHSTQAQLLDQWETPSLLVWINEIFVYILTIWKFGYDRYLPLSVVGSVLPGLSVVLLSSLGMVRCISPSLIRYCDYFEPFIAMFIGLYWPQVINVYTNNWDCIILRMRVSPLMNSMVTLFYDN